MAMLTNIADHLKYIDVARIHIITNHVRITHKSDRDVI